MTHWEKSADAYPHPVVKPSLKAACPEGLDRVLRRFDSEPEPGMFELGVKPQRPRHGASPMREQRARTAWRIVVDQIKGIVVLPPSATLAAAVFGRQIDAQDLVPGGIVLLEVNPLQCDETALTEVLHRS